MAERRGRVLCSLCEVCEPMNESKVPLPDRVYKKDRKFQGGFFVAANTKIGEDGTALFGQTQGVEEMWHDRVCQTCGRRIALDDWCVFPGGMSLYKYEEAPLHIDCARYALLVCPHIKQAAAKNEFNFGVSVCKKYYIVEFEAPHWMDPGCIPDWSGIKMYERMFLDMAHDIRGPDEAHEKTWCATCPPGQENIGRMTYKEFISWSGRYAR